MDDANALNEFAYVIPLQGYVFKIGGVWNLSTPVGKDGISHFLADRGIPNDVIQAALKTRSYLMVHGAEVAPNAPDVFLDQHGARRINLWVPPKLKATPGEYPTIEKILLHLCDGDEDAVIWLSHWLALKVQEPDIVLKVAVVLSTKPGAGKGTLFRVIEEMMGRDNCIEIGAEALSSRFNSMWVQKLFVQANECVTSDNLKDVSQRLKLLIDSPKVELEGKGTNQEYVTNRTAWIFSSNDVIAPVQIEAGDRRYTVFTNHSPLTQEWKDMLRSCYGADKQSLSPHFQAEVEAFYYDLLNLEVDRDLVAFPFDNDARAGMIHASRPAHDLFFSEVNEGGIDGMLERLLIKGDYLMQKLRPHWDFGDRGISTEMLYACYVEYCKGIGARSMRSNKFGVAVRNQRPAWEHVRNTVPNTNKRVNCYVVKRTPGEKK